ncbi:MAG: hypothetical protein EZS28_003778 [Streblomastix strix]|uniref:Eukaryotic translation initiation factor 4E n=1 Tax=Streblomastix strix TaxID=222440 RepID=A0A5J4X082_9EUKA|nr:MAG: hypothetical protein EZS28_003778 [Streblomastix strix]
MTELKYKFSLYFQEPSKQSGKVQKSEKDWMAGFHHIYTCTTLENFWRMCHNIPRPQKIPARSSYYMFKEGVKPAWEDKENVGGGRFQIIQKQTLINRDHFEFVFFDLLILLVCDQLPSTDLITGVQFNNNKQAIEIWVKKGINQELLRKAIEDDINALLAARGIDGKLTSQAIPYTSFEKAAERR